MNTAPSARTQSNSDGTRSDSADVPEHEPIREMTGWERNCLQRLMTPTLFPEHAATGEVNALAGAEAPAARDVRHVSGEVERLRHTLQESQRKTRRIAWIAGLSGAAVMLAIWGVREAPAWIKRAGEPVPRVGRGFSGTFAVSIGERVPEFRGYILYPDGPDGRAMSQQDWLGRRVVLLAWRAGDEASRQALQSLSGMFNGSSLAGVPDTLLLGLCLEENHAAAVEAVEAAGATGWEHVWDHDPRTKSDERMSARMNVSTAPSIYIFDPLTRLQYMGISADAVPPSLKVLSGEK